MRKTYNCNTNNMVHLRGLVAHVNEDIAGKAATVVIAVDNGDNPMFVRLKNYKPGCYSLLRVGMLVNVHGHVAVRSREENGKTAFDQEFVADFIEFLESKAAVDIRKAAKAAAPPMKVDVLQRGEFHD